MQVDYYTKVNCRLCNSKNLVLVLELNKSPLCDAYLHKKEEQTFYDLNLLYCKNCCFVQIDTIIDPEIIYKDYIYITSSSTGLIEHFYRYSDNVINSLNLDKNGLVIDIGSNEGSLLKAFQNRGYKVLGVEPSLKAANIANSNFVETICDFFNKNLANKVLNNYGEASLITVNNLFANIDDLYEFADSIKSLLSKDGVLIIESSYLIDMINNMVFDFIYHEHLSYFSILPLVEFFNKLDMHLIDIEHVDTKGGSLRYYWSKKISSRVPTNNVIEMIEKEKKFAINEEIFKEYNININIQKEKLISFLEQNINKEIVGFGASATSTTLISHFGLDKYLTYLVDENEVKIGTLSPGFHIPVYNIDKLKNENEKIIIILAWRYEKNIMQKIDKYSNSIIIPLPFFTKGVKNG